jgi:hypothetical protein
MRERFIDVERVIGGNEIAPGFLTRRCGKMPAQPTSKKAKQQGSSGQAK